MSAEKNGGPPVTISKMSTPNDQKSAAASWPFLRITSGAMQNSVPFIEKVRRSSSTCEGAIDSSDMGLGRDPTVRRSSSTFATLKSVRRT